MDKNIFQLVQSFAKTQNVRANYTSQDKNISLDFVSFETVSQSLTGFLIFNNFNKLLQLIELIKQKQTWLYVDQLWIVDLSNNEALTDATVWIIKQEKLPVSVAAFSNQQLNQVYRNSSTSPLYLSYVKPIEVQQFFTLSPSINNNPFLNQNPLTESPFDNNNQLFQATKSVEPSMETMEFSRFMDEFDQITKNFSDIELEPMQFTQSFDDWSKD